MLVNHFLSTCAMEMAMFGCVSCYCPSIYLCFSSLNFVMRFLRLLFQVQEDGLWNNVDKGNATYLYARQKAMEIVNNLLETRDTSIG